MSHRIDRRDFLALAVAGGATAAMASALLAGDGGHLALDAGPSATGRGAGIGTGGGGGNGTGGGNGAGRRSGSSVTIAPPTATTRLVRLYSVVTPIEGGLYGDLLPDFERETGYRVQLTGSSPDVYGPARAGHADLVISHYGHHDAEAFVLDGFGSWPETVFFNPMALLGPPSDPAEIRGLTDAAEAFRRIATMHAPFVVNNIEGVKYLGEILWNAIGQPDRAGWYQDHGLREHDAVAAAAQQTGYTFWGLTPFLTSQQHTPVALEPMVLEDPLLQRIMVSIRVLPKHVPGVNTPGATALQHYLLEPTTQARIRAFRYPGIDRQIWWPAGRDNASTLLPQ